MRRLVSFVAAPAFAAVAADPQSMKEQKPASTADAKRSGTATTASKCDTVAPRK